MPELSSEDIMATLARGRGAIDADDDRISAEIVQDLAERESLAQAEIREKLRSEVLTGEVEVDPSLLEAGDEVAEETVSQYRHVNHIWGERVFLAEGGGPGSQSRFSPDEQRSHVQRAVDMCYEDGVSKTRALSLVAAEIGVAKQTVSDWASKWGIEFPAPDRSKKVAGDSWSLVRREELFDRQMEIASIMTDRIRVGLEYLAEDEPTRPRPSWMPADWNPANELKTVVVAAAIVHDKRTGIEDLKVARGIREVDSEELQNELSDGRARLLQMGGSNGEEEEGTGVYERGYGVGGEGAAE